MDNAKQHWKILEKLGNDLENRVRSFLMIGSHGEGVIVVTESGEGFWLGELWFGSGKLRTANEPTPLDIPELVQMAHCYRHILLLNKRGKIYAMGDNRGQLGLGDADRKMYYVPQLISIPHKFISVRCGFENSLALTEDGKCWAWGLVISSQVGVPISNDHFSSPCQIPEFDPHRVVTIECGGYHSLALTDLSEVYAWGSNGEGQLGNGSVISTHTPTRIPTPSPVQSMAAGCYHTLPLTQTGEVWACGDNQFFQLGLPTTTKSSASLVKVEGLPLISQIASNPAINLSIAMSSDQRCFVWGQMANRMPISIPRKLPLFYSTVESPLSFFSDLRFTPHSVTIPETLPSPLSARMCRMFDNPETSPDVQFVVEQRTIHAHRIILSNSSDYFAQIFSETCLSQVDPKDPIVKITIPDHSYQVFHAFLSFLYTDSLELHPELLPKLFELAIQYLESYLQQLCLSRMRATLTPTTCCLYYQLTHRHSKLPELATFQQELVQFASTRMSKVIATSAFQTMDAKLCKMLTISI